MSWTFPWTMHFARTDFRAFGDNTQIFNDGPDESKRVLTDRVGRGDSTISKTQLADMRSSLEQLHIKSQQFTHTATFALGGFVPLYYLANRRGAYERNGGPTRNLHLFAGLSWGAPPAIRVKPFDDFLLSLEDADSLLIFDVGSVGHGVMGAANRIKYLLAHELLIKRPRIHLLGLVDGASEKQTVTRNDLEKQCVKSAVHNITMEFALTPAIRVVDDVCHLQGYIQMRKEAKLQPYKNSGLISFVDDNGKFVQGIGCSDSAGNFFQVIVKGFDYLDPNRFQDLV